MDWAHEAMGGLTGVINNAGIYPMVGLLDMSDEDWRAVVDANLTSVFVMTQVAARAMIEAKTRGAIVNISSLASIAGSFQTGYELSKAAMNRMTESIALANAGRGIRCNAVLPGLMHTPLLYQNDDVVMINYGSPEKMVAERDAQSPTGKMGTGWDIANAAVFLASDEANYINGVLLPVDGGLICKMA